MKFCFLLFTATVLAQTPKPAGKPWTLGHTADGQPDLQGIWSGATITPLERPAELAAKQSFTEQEARAYEKELLTRNNMDRRDGPVDQDVGRAYNDFWWDRGQQIVKTRRTSLIVDPPDGRLPTLTAPAQKRQADRAARLQRPANGPEDRSLGERCILLGAGAAPIVPTAYNNNYQIVQSPGVVTIFSEMIHDVRVIPLDGRSQPPAYSPPNARGNHLCIGVYPRSDEAARPAESRARRESFQRKW